MKLNNVQKMALDNYIMESLENGSNTIELLASGSWSGLKETNIRASLKRLATQYNYRYHFTLQYGVIDKKEVVFGILGIEKVKNKLYFTSFNKEKNDGFYYDFLTNELKMPDEFNEKTVAYFEKIKLPGQLQKLEWLFNYAEITLNDLPQLRDWAIEAEPKGFNQHFTTLNAGEKMPFENLRKHLTDFNIAQKIGKGKKIFFDQYFDLASPLVQDYLEKISLKDISQLAKNSIMRGEKFDLYDMVCTLRSLYNMGLEVKMEADRTIEYFLQTSRVRIEEAQYEEYSKSICQHQSKILALQELDLENYVIVVPLTVAEILEEARQQRNCLASYIRRIANGQTSIYFLRNKENPEASFVTCEYRRSETVQANTKGNHQTWLRDPIIKVIDEKIREITEM